MSSPVETIIADPKSQDAKAAPTQLNEVPLDRNEEDEEFLVDVENVPSNVTYRNSLPAYRLHETETVGGVQEVCLNNSKSVWTRYIGIILALLSTLMFSFNQIAQKVLLKHHRKFRNGTIINDFSPFNMAAWTFPFQIIFTIPLLIYRNKCENKEFFRPIRPFKQHCKTQILIVIRSFTDSGSYILFFICLGYLDLGEAVVIVSIAPVIVYVLCRIFLKEPVGYVIIFTAALAIGGVVVISEPPGIGPKGKPYNMNKLWGIMYALSATLGLAISMVAVRFMKHIYHGVLNAISYMCGAVLAIIFAAAFKKLTVPYNFRPFTEENEWFLLIIISGMTVIGQTLLILALQYEQAGPVSLIRTLGVLLAFLWQMAFLGITPSKYSAIGGAMIVVGVIITILRKWISMLPEDNTYRQRFAFLLK